VVVIYFVSSARWVPPQLCECLERPKNNLPGGGDRQSNKETYQKEGDVSINPYLSGGSLGGHELSGIVSETRLIASKNVIDDAFHLVRDECHEYSTKVNVAEVY